MKAYAYKITGKASNVVKLIELPTPQVKKNEVRIQVRATIITPYDTKKRSGELPHAFNSAQVIPHSDGSGVIDRVGSGIDAAWVGKRVWFHNPSRNSPNGAAGEYVTLPLEDVSPLPEQVAFSEGATLGIPLLTAWYCIYIAGSLKDKTVFVENGESSVGSYAIQLAKQQGATVISSVRAKENEKCARHYGADHVINHQENDIIKSILNITNKNGVNHYINVNNDLDAQQISKILAYDASLVIYNCTKNTFNINNIFQFQIKRTNIVFFLAYDLPQSILKLAKKEIHQLLVTNSLKFNIKTIYQFSDIIQAHEAVEQGESGNIVLCQCPLQIANHLQK